VLADPSCDTNEEDEDGMSALIHAVAAGSMECVSLLLVHGADIGVTYLLGQIVLHCTVNSHCIETVNFILNHCMGVGAMDNSGVTLLHYAAAVAPPSMWLRLQSAVGGPPESG
jgi:ankyrin repeat protein